MKEIVVIVDAEGNTSVEAFGFKKKSCLDATKAFEQVLGGAGKRKMKREAFMAEQTASKTKARGK